MTTDGSRTEFESLMITLRVRVEKGRDDIIKLEEIGKFDDDHRWFYKW